MAFSPMDVKPLPLPELKHTLVAYKQALHAVLEPSKYQHVDTVIDNFQVQYGELHQHLLNSRAQQRADAGSNWMAQEWYASYLADQEPLPLSTNVGFQLDLPDAPPGLDGVAEHIARIASVHLDVARKTLPQQYDARGNTLSMDQWFVFNGGIRTPGNLTKQATASNQSPTDTVEPCTLGAAKRCIGIFYRGHLWALHISDERGLPIAPHALHDALETIIASTDIQKAGQFHHVSLLGSGTAAPLLHHILLDARNARIYTMLRDFLFTVELIETQATSTQSLLEKLSFRPSGAWAYKPLSYQLAIDSSWAGIHVEHSCIDGATLLSAMEKIHKTQLPKRNPLQEVPEQLRWHLSPYIEAKIASHYAAYQHDAAQLSTAVVAIADQTPTHSPFKMSNDASFQLILSVAQQLTYGHIRSAYEAVDMREYRAGRTECLRPVTQQAVEFAQIITTPHLARHTEMVAESLRDAHEAHRQLIKQCKSGNGFERHIEMLETINAAPEIFHDADVLKLRSNFLSTTSLGSDTYIKRYTFAPSEAGGFGITYTHREGLFEYFISWCEQSAESPKEFIANIDKAAQLYWQAVECATA